MQRLVRKHLVEAVRDGLNRMLQSTTAHRRKSISCKCAFSAFYPVAARELFGHPDSGSDTSRDRSW